MIIVSGDCYSAIVKTHRNDQKLDKDKRSDQDRYPFEPSPPSLNLVASIDQQNILIEHHGGESISLDAQIRILIGSSNQYSIIAEDYLNSNSSDNDEYWEIGELVVYNPGIELSGKRIETTIVDKETKSVVMTGIIQGGNN